MYTIPKRIPPPKTLPYKRKACDTTCDTSPAMLIGNIIQYGSKKPLIQALKPVFRIAATDPIT